MAPLNPEQISRFYERWSEAQVHRDCGGLWRKQYKLRMCGDQFISLNKVRNRLSFPSLKALCIEYTPSHVYMSVLNWSMPETVGEKRKSGGAYPVGGEYVIDIDSYLNYQKHTHRVTDDGVCEGCLGNSKELTARLVDKVSENYRDIKIVFSGKSGFHVHVLDFDVRDWAEYSENNPLKSHEVARYLYTKTLQTSTGGFDNPHFIVSSDVMRVITFPESLNGETGLICSYLSNSRDFSKLKVTEILEDASRSKGVVQGNTFTPLNMIHTRLEPLQRGVVIQTQITCGGAEARR